MQNVEKRVDNLQSVVYYTSNLQNVGGDKMGLTVKQWRLAKGISQEQMANECGVHRNTYASWEDAPDDISVKNAKIIARVLGESVDSIFFNNSSTKCRIHVDE